MKLLVNLFLIKLYIFFFYFPGKKKKSQLKIIRKINPKKRERAIEFIQKTQEILIMDSEIQQRMNDKDKWYSDAAQYWEVCYIRCSFISQ